MTCAPASSSAAGQEPEAGADLQHALARARLRLAQDPVEHVDVGEEVLRQRWRGAQAGLAERPADGERVEPRARRRRDVRDALARADSAVTAQRIAGAAAAATAARRGRGRPARRPRTAVRRPRRSSPRCRCTAPGRGTISGMPRASASPASRSRSTRFAATPPPSTMPRAPTASAARIVFVDQHVDHRVLEAPRELRGTRVGERRRRGRRPGARSAPRRVDDPPRGGLQAGEAEVVRVAAARRAGRRGRRACAASAAAQDRRPARVAAGPAAGRPCRTPRPRRRRPSGRGAGSVRWSRISTRNVCPPETTSATSGNGGGSRLARPGRAARPRRRGPRGG